MSRMNVLEGTPPRVLYCKETGPQGCEPRLCWREILQLVLDGSFPRDHRLEHLLDRIERLP